MDTTLALPTLDLATEENLPQAMRAYLALERMIVMLELEPGAAYTEAFLLDRLEFGRTPVREALQRLEWEGLVDIRPRAGIAIAPIVAGDWIKVTQTRYGPECLLMRSAALSGHPGAHERMREAGTAMQKATVSESTLMFLRADKAFDAALATAADNAYAARAVAPLQSHSRRFWFRYQSDRGLTEAAGNHLAVIDAILNGDADRAETAARTMLDLNLRYARRVAGQ